MRRREFIAGLGSTAAWPAAVHAQPRDQMRRIGVFMSTAQDDTESSARIAALLEGLAELGWIDGRTLLIDTRWAAGDPDRARRYAAELVALAPEVILASGGSVAGTLLQITRSVPIVFTLTPDPVGAGFVASLARPGGNATGFSEFEYGISGKWLELLKEMAPRVTRVAVLRDAIIPQGVGQFAVIQAAALQFRLDVSPIDVRDAGEIERAITAFARTANVDHHPGRSAQTACDLFPTLLRRQRRPNLLRA
jgi:putative tryptophan/tyrosine transport system substrate-binding protein